MKKKKIYPLSLQKQRILHIGTYFYIGFLSQCKLSTVSSSPESLGQFQPHFKQSNHGWREFKLSKMAKTLWRFLEVFSGTIRAISTKLGRRHPFIEIDMFQILEFLQEYFLQQNLNVFYVFIQFTSSIDIIIFLCQYCHDRTEL